MKLWKFLLGSLIFSLPLMATNIYDEVDALEFDPIGYFATQSSLDKIFREREIKTVIELGSWAGASTRFLGFRVGENGKVYAIDHWLGTPGHPGEVNDPRLSYIYQLFLSNIRYMGLTDRIIPLRMTTDEALKALHHVSADLIYIDASRNSEQVYRDIMNWSWNLNEEGVICGAEWREPEVREGVTRAAHDLNKQIESDRKGFFWVLK